MDSNGSADESTERGSTSVGRGGLQVQLSRPPAKMGHDSVISRVMAYEKSRSNENLGK